MRLICSNRISAFASRRFGIANHPRREGSASRAKLDVYLATLCTGALFFIQAFHAPGVPAIGLDASWRLALSEAHVAGLQFGKDITFTFGSLGYLTYGLPVAETYVPMLAASAAVALLCAVLGMALSAYAEGIAVRLSFVLALAVALPQASESLYFITILAWMLPVFRNRGRFALAATVLGVFSALAGLTEFKLAFVGFFGGILLLGGNALMAYRARRDASGLANLACFCAAYFVAFGYAFARRDYGSIATFAIVAVAAIALGYLLWPLRTYPFARIASPAALVLGLGLVLAPTCRIFVARSAQLASGYSAAMSVPGNQSELVLALCVLVIFTLLAVLQRKRLTYPVAAALALGAFGAFKEGFVRQDPPHVLFFFVILVPVVAAIALLSSRRTQPISLTLSLLVLAMYDIVFHSYSLGDVVVSSLTPAAVVARAAAASQAVPLVPIPAAHFVAGLAGDGFSKDIQAAVGSQTADVLPWETAAIFANGFTWDPEPAFQSYSVLSAAVDQMNAEHLENHGASRVFYEWVDVDGRYPLWDEAGASAVLLCRYRLAGSAPSIATTQSGGSFLALKRGAERCGNVVSSKPAQVTWRDQIQVPRGRGLTFAKLRFRYNVLGYLARTLFRVPSLNVTIVNGAGQTATFRILRDTSNDGILIDPLPADLTDLGKLFSGSDSVQAVRSFSIDTGAPYLYESGIDVRFESVAYRAP